MKPRVDHIGVAVRDTAERLRFWSEALGLPVDGRETVESEGVHVTFLRAGDTRIELLEPTGETSPIAKFIDKRGEGINHLTLRVRDMERVLERLAEAGVPAIGDAPRPGAGGSRVAFLHPRACGGVLVELVEGGAGAPTGSVDLTPGEPVLAYLGSPQEKLWGVLRRLDSTGLVIEGVDLASFEDWLAQIDRGDESVVGASVQFVPAHRIERIVLDRASGDLPSLADRFRDRVGKSVQAFLAG